MYFEKLSTMKDELLCFVFKLSDVRMQGWINWMKKIIVGISGASAIIYGVRLLEVLRTLPDVETHLVMSTAGGTTLRLETDYSLEQVNELADVTYRFKDIAATISSGSFKTDGMVVIPCSMKTLAGIANSFSDNLLLRAADVVLKDRRRLVLVPG